ncbi:RNA exonuclease 5-like [Anomaloglossus baeobatrachus]|uniref:RNA exonuclease 5-like n=1 Tax=Anomaloglossus baeobatrachus TaxID=238106 RepID=UPI003F50CA6C
MITYKTRLSRITKKKLHPVKTKLKDVQERIKALLPPDAVLVGHSLENDLRALQMIHPNVIDTSILFARNPGRRFRLKFLAQVILKREIQRADANGHDPSEDAVAALNLAQYVIQHGPEKVADINLEEIFLMANNLHSRGGNPKTSEIKPNRIHPPPQGPSCWDLPRPPTDQPVPQTGHVGDAVTAIWDLLQISALCHRAVVPEPPRPCQVNLLPLQLMFRWQWSGLKMTRVERCRSRTLPLDQMLQHVVQVPELHPTVACVVAVAVFQDPAAAGPMEKMTKKLMLL